MRQPGKKLLMAAVTAIFAILLAIPAMAYGPDTVVFRTAENPSAGCALVALDGVYIADAEAAVKRINEIRLEACKEGIDNPSNQGTPLTEADYVPIKWSSSLEYIARVRAAEAGVVMGHTRPNGSTCWTVKAPDGEQSFGEVLAWNSSASMIPGINQWYEEKADWVNKTSGAVTGHYTQMIDPTNLYVGIGCYLSRNGAFYNTTAGEFSTNPGAGSNPMQAVPDCRVIIEIKKDAFSSVMLVGTSAKLQKEGALDKGDIISSALGMSVVTVRGTRQYKAVVFDMGNIQWTTSDSSIATVNAQGDVLIRGVGQVVIKATSDSGNSASDTLNPAHTPTTVKGTAATCAKTGLTDGQKCSVCGEILIAQQTIAAKGHTAVTVKGTAATCTKTGLTDGQKCSVCGEILKAQQTIAAKGHTPITIKGTAATCTKTGLTDGQKCSVCGTILKKQNTIKAKGHKVVKDKAVDPTFASTGLTEGTHCSVCKMVLKAQKKVPKLTTVPTSVKAAVNKNKVTVSWKKVTDKKLLKQIKSIQVQYSTDKNFKKKAVTKTVDKKKAKITLSLKKKTTYYIRVRFKGVKGNSKWSGTKKVKTKK